MKNDRPKGKFQSKTFFPKNAAPKAAFGRKPPFAAKPFSSSPFPKRNFKAPFRPSRPAEKKEIPAKTSWGSVAPWYDDMLEKGEGTYQKEVILPNLLRLVDAKPEENIIDIACGQGFFSRVLAEAGAKVVGCDISSELVSLAKSNVPKAVFHVSPAEKLGFASDGYFSKAVIVLAIQNIKGVDNAFREAARVLRPDGYDKQE